MLTGPQDTLGDLSAAADDYDPMNNPGGSCQNKLCQDKRAMNDVLPAYSTLVQFGLAGYFQYQKANTITSGGGTTDCWYDVLAPPGETRLLTFYTDNGPSFQCVPPNCINEPNYTCTKVGYDPAGDTVVRYSADRGNAIGSSSFTNLGRTYKLTSITNEPEGPPWTSFQFSGPPYPTAAVYDASFIDTTDTAWGCTPSNPCQFFYRDQQIISPTLTQTWYQDHGSAYVSGGTTYTLSSSSISNFEVRAPPCPDYVETTSAVSGCSVGTPCDMKNVGVDSSTTTDTQYWHRDLGPNYTDPSSGAVYTKAGSCTTESPFEVLLTNAAPTCNTAGYSETSNWGCGAAPNDCAMTYLGRRVAPGEVTQYYCQYSRPLCSYQATITRSLCIDTQTTYSYTAPGPPVMVYDYARKDYNFDAPAYTYSYLTRGGEYKYALAFRQSDVNAWCGSVYNNGFADGTCPTNLNGAGYPCPNDGTQCVPSWRSPLALPDGGTAYGNGRLSNYNGDPSLAVDCLAVDYPDGGIPQPNPGGYQTDWCSGLGSVTTTSTEYRLQSDYYDPPTANSPDSGIPMSNKYSGWSRTEGPGPKNPAPVFIDFADNNFGNILSAFQKYYPIDAPRPNALGLRVAQNNNYIDYTPLYGSLRNAYDYLSTQIDADPDYACRRYFFMMVTDGQEFSPKNYTTTDLVNAVTALRNLTTPGGRRADVQTFVIGFGNLAVGGALDPMARAGGTAVDPVTLRTDLVSGRAFSALDEGTLSQTLNLAFSSVVFGTFSRSAPLVAPLLTVNGSRAYAGYFSLVPNSQEWFGGLVAANISSTGSVSATVWDYANQVNSQPTRTIYTKVPSNSGLIYFDTSSSGANLIPQNQTDLYIGMNTTQAEGDKTITFLRNMSNSERFVDGAVKSSRASDIYHSNPAIVGAALHDVSWGGSTPARQAGYQAYKNATVSRELTIYVGANDGMLHALREDGAASPATWAGNERWAYVPPGAQQQLVASRTSHTFSVDGSFGVEDVCLAPCAAATDWRTILIGSLRDGGPALYALDVTDPNNPVYLWDFTQGNLGSTWSAPVIARATINTAGGPQEKWVAFFGGGVSALANHGNYIYAVDALTGAILVDNTNTEAAFKVDMNAPLPKNNLPSRLTVYRPQDGSYAAAAYFTDTQGRVSRMDLTGQSTASWQPKRFFDPSDSTCKTDIFGNTATPIRLASDGSQVGTLPLANSRLPPPIYVRPVVGRDSTGRRMVFAGSGDSVNPTSPTGTNYFYAIRDSDTGAICSGIPAWVKQFAPGEKVLGTPALVGKGVILATYTPPPAGAACNQAGAATLYAFDAVNGTAANLLKDALGNNVSRLSIPNSGIISDLQVSGRSLIFNTSNNPTQVQSIPINNATGIGVKSWKRMR